ncbi:hypothetical protein P9112_003181 [Eukaryota sp. TZLM1-RC]
MSCPFHTIARIRPFLPEEADSSPISFDCSSSPPSVILSGKGTLAGIARRYPFHEVYGPNSSQSDLFSSHITSLLDSTLNGNNTSVLTFGATNTGKTWTLFGKSDQSLDSITTRLSPSSGLVPRSLEYLFKSLPPNHFLSLSLIEIYSSNDRDYVIDLLSPYEPEVTPNKKTLSLAWNEDRFEVKDNIKGDCNSLVDALFLVQVGLENRSVRDRDIYGTNNSKYLPSSRSHCLLCINVRSKKSRRILGAITFADLAGSERFNPENNRESSSINQSLSVLSKVISSLKSSPPSSTFIPWRESTLTKLLWPCLDPSRCTTDSFKTVLITTLSPCFKDWSGSLQGLLVATCAQSVVAGGRKSPSLFDSLGLEKSCRNCEELGKQNEYLRRELSILQKSLSEFEVNAPKCVDGKAAVKALLDANHLLRYNLAIVEQDRNSLSSQSADLFRYIAQLEETIEEVKANQSNHQMIDRGTDTPCFVEDPISLVESQLEHEGLIEGNGLEIDQFSIHSKRSIQTEPPRPKSATSSVKLSFSNPRPSSANSCLLASARADLDRYRGRKRGGVKKRPNSGVKSRILRR